MFGPARFILFLCLMAASCGGLAFEPRISFASDPAAARSAARQAGDMIRFAQIELAVSLDWSEASIAVIEDLAAALQADLRRERGSYHEVRALVQMLGCYVGEVYRRNHGGEWGYVTTRGQRRMALRSADGNRVLWPIERVQQRLRSNGHNVLAYYQRNTTPTAN